MLCVQTTERRLPCVVPLILARASFNRDCLLSPHKPRSSKNQAGNKLQADGVAELSETMGSPVQRREKQGLSQEGIELQCVVMDRLKTWNQRPHVISWSSLMHCMSWDTMCESLQLP